ncbi:hypothetical protein [Streptomyces sp. NPDC005017]|uniref:hypothetical protein n=1 Tax=Streptomyces sp. NPDC005017 TaxID=3364706 RepID=UPI0036A9509E
MDVHEAGRALKDWFENPVPFGQHVLDAFGLPLDLSEVAEHKARWGVIIVTVLLATALLQALPDAARAMARPAFWRDSGRILPAVQVLLLAVAYAFYGNDQTESLSDAAGHVLDGQLAEAAPFVILTYWLLSCVFWVWFGRLLGLSYRRLMTPFAELRGLLVGALFVGAFAVAWLQAADRGSRLGVAQGSAVTAAVVLGAAYFTEVGAKSLAGRTHHLIDPLGTNAPWLQSMPHPDGPAWRVSVRRLTATFLLFTLSWSLIAALISALYWAGAFEPPSALGVLRVCGFLYGITLLVWCFRFRSMVFAQRDLPPVLPRFVDLSLALSTVAVAAGSLPDAHLTIGNAPPWAVAIGPPATIAALLLVVVIGQSRTQTPRWRQLLRASLLAAVLIVPLRLALGL